MLLFIWRSVSRPVLGARLTCGLLLVAASSPAISFAQDDLFGPPLSGGIFDAPIDGQEETAGAIVGNTDEDAEQEPDPLTEQLRVKARYGGIKRAEAISSLARIGRWSDVNRVLSQVNSEDADADLLAAMSQKIEPALKLRIDRRPEIDDTAREALNKLRKAEADFAHSEQRLENAVANLGATSVDERIGAIRALLSGGNVAIKNLVNAAVKTEPPAPRDDILRTLLRLGDGGTKALRQLALYGEPSVRLGALKSLVRIDKNEAVDELVTAVNASDSTDDELAFASSVLAQVPSGAPNRSNSIAYLGERLQGKLSDAKLVDNDQATIALWYINKNRDGIEFQSSSSMMAAYRDTSDAASRLRRIDGLPPGIANEVIVAEMGYRVILDPDWGDEGQLKAIRGALASALAQTSLIDAVSHAMELDAEPAAIGLLRLIGATDDPLLHSRLLTSASPDPSPLVMAAISASPRVRYEAATAISGFEFSMDYPGSSLVQQTLSEMASLSDLPTAVLVETRADVLLIQEKILHDHGYAIRVASNTADAERAVNLGGDLRMLISKVQLADTTAVELVDRIRRLSRGEQLPIVFYGTVPEHLDTPRWDAPVLFMDHAPGSPAAHFELLHDMERRSRLPEMTQLDRELYRQIGTKAIQ
ncbi:hypothetical protein CA13_23480 [Planctomycetes bacterium CA13]|uniref:Response regulatory domain-containing protein n=1 Tax=Novipirellula herctigrandis TaxID=2527986 RepID=A0A5C5Z0K0_9BACT|nr:hypothetical protein CA13_23480 [Planctomycetes bacterium CA13]